MLRVGLAIGAICRRCALPMVCAVRILPPGRRLPAPGPQVNREAPYA